MGRRTAVPGAPHCGGMTVKLQIALDDLTLEQALRLVSSVREYVDIVEIGTPFLYQYGMEAVRAMKHLLHDREVLADMKIMDAGAYEAGEAFEAGADYVTVLDFIGNDYKRSVQIAFALGGLGENFVLEKKLVAALVEEDFDDEEFTEYLQEHTISDFAGIEFDAYYDTTFACMAEDPENPAIPLIRYLITLVRCPMREVEGLIKMAAGKYADELDIPMSDVEEEYLEVEE